MTKAVLTIAIELRPDFAGELETDEALNVWADTLARRLEELALVARARVDMVEIDQG